MGISHKSKICLARGSLASLEGDSRTDCMNGEPLNYTVAVIRYTHIRPRLTTIHHHPSSRGRYTHIHTHARARKPDGGSPRGQGREPFAGDHNQLAHASRVCPLASIRVAVRAPRLSARSPRGRQTVIMLVH